MTDVRLRPMRPDEFEPWSALQAEGYVDQLVDMGGLTPAEAGAKATTDWERLLPDGFRTTGHRFLAAERDGRHVGWLWLGAGDDPDDPDVVWVYDIEIEADARGQGVGRQVMLLAEDEVHDMGARAIMLNVMAGNAVAIGLYDSLGYEVVLTHPTGQNMRMAVPA